MHERKEQDKELTLMLDLDFYERMLSEGLGPNILLDEALTCFALCRVLIYFILCRLSIFI